MRIAERLRAQPALGFKSVKLLEVTGLGDTSVVATDGLSENTYPATSGYLYRKVGDTVLAAQLPGGSWYVLCAVSVPALPDPVDEEKVKAVIVRQTQPEPPPDDDFTMSVDAGSWRVGTGQSDAEVVKAGSWTGADWFGGWFFGTAIQTMCAAGTVQSMTVRVRRTTGSAGWNRGVRLHFGLHSEDDLAKPTLTDLWDGPLISKGAYATVAIPSAQRALLAAGTKKGIGVYGAGRDSYLILAPSARVDVTFS